MLLEKSVLAACAVLALVGQSGAEKLRNKWCSGFTLRFFVGGAEGDAFAPIVYNGAVQAAKDTGADVDYVFSGWSSEKMVQQLREAVAAGPAEIAMMEHPGNAAIMRLAKDAAAAGKEAMRRVGLKEGDVAFVLSDWSQEKRSERELGTIQA